MCENMSTTNTPQYRRLTRYPVSLHVKITSSMAAEIGQLAGRAEWPAAEVVRQALEAGLANLDRRLEQGAEQ